MTSKGDIYAAVVAIFPPDIAGLILPYTEHTNAEKMLKAIYKLPKTVYYPISGRLTSIGPGFAHPHGCSDACGTCAARHPPSSATGVGEVGNPAWVYKPFLYEGLVIVPPCESHVWYIGAIFLDKIITGRAYPSIEDFLTDASKDLSGNFIRGLFVSEALALW